MENIEVDFEKSFWILFESDIVGIAITGKGGRIMRSNRTFQKMLGYSEDDLKDICLHDITHPGDADDNTGLFHKMVAGERDHYRMEKRYIRKDGGVMWANLAVSAVRDKDGEYLYNYGIIEDITDRKKVEEEIRSQKESLEERVDERTMELTQIVGQLTREITEREEAQESLRESEEKYRSLFEAESDAIFLVDPETADIMDVNPAATRLFGYTREELFDMKVTDISAEPENTWTSLKNEGLVNVPVRYSRKKDGTLFPMEISATSFVLMGQRINISTVRDISVRIKAEEELKRYTRELKRLKDFNENIVQTMEEGIWIEDHEGFLTFVNPRMHQMLSCSQGDLIGRHWSEIFSTEYGVRVKEENTLVRLGKKSRYEGALEHNDMRVDVMVSVTPLWEDGLYVGNFKVFVDITERKAKEEALWEKALKYKVHKGGSYLVTEKEADRGIHVLKDLLHGGYKGMVLTRALPEKIRGEVGDDVETLWFSEKKKGSGTIPDTLDMVEKVIEDFMSTKRVVLLDRLDYLVVRNGFDEVLKLLQRLAEVTYMAKGILLVSIDPDTLKPRELSLLGKEVQLIESKFKLDLEKEYRDLLEFIMKENREGRRPVHKDIVAVLGITRPTLIKRVGLLKSEGLLLERKTGRFKTLEATDHARETLNF